MNNEWKVEMIRPVARFGWDVRIYRSVGPSQYETLVCEPGGWVIYPVESSAVEIRPSLHLPDEVLAILRKGFDLVPQDKAGQESATERHLGDAVAVRDRLLTMVESAFPKT